MKKLYKRIKLFYIKRTKDGVTNARYQGVKIGSNCRLYIKYFGSEPWLITIGNNVTITTGVILLTHDGSTWLMRDAKGRRFLYRKIIIKDNVFIGVNSVIMPGVIIESNVVIAAGSIVTKSVPSGVVIGGNPAKIIGDYSNYKKKILNEYVSEIDLDYSVDYKTRINKVLDDSFKKYLVNKY